MLATNRNSCNESCFSYTLVHPALNEDPITCISAD